MPKRITKGPPFSLLESMAGAVVWHRIARRVFVQQILTEDHKNDGTHLDLVENEELAETLLHSGQLAVEGDIKSHRFGGFHRVAVNLYNEFKKRVDEVGGGDVSLYAKRTTGKTERYEFEEWQEIDGRKRSGGRKEQ